MTRAGSLNMRAMRTSVMRAASLQRALSAGPFGHRNNEDRENGAGEAIRTPDPNLGKVVLYP